MPGAADLDPTSIDFVEAYVTAAVAKCPPPRQNTIQRYDIEMEEMRNNEIFTRFSNQILKEHPAERVSAIILGGKKFINLYDKLARDTGLTTHLCLDDKGLQDRIAAASDIVLILVLRDRFSQSIKDVLASACEKIDPLYIPQLYSYDTVEKETGRILTHTNYGHRPVIDSPKARQVAQATARVFRRGNEGGPLAYLL